MSETTSYRNTPSCNLFLFLIFNLFFVTLPLCSCVKKADSTTAGLSSTNSIEPHTVSAEQEQAATLLSKANINSGIPDPVSPKKREKQQTAAKSQKKKSGKAKKILETAYTQIGRMYHYGGTSPKTGFDCSGFTRWVFAQNAIKLPRSSGEQLHAGKPVKRKDLRPGDLLIYSRRIGRRRGTHVGIYVGNGKFIHSPRSGHRIQVSDAFDNYRTRRFITARRVIEDPNAAPLPEEQQQYLTQTALTHNKPRHEPPKLHENTFAESYTIYRVKPGDTISGLANRFHVPTRTLLAANQLRKRDVLQLSQRLMIPAPGGSTGTIVKPGQKGPERRNVVKHKIKRGETLGALALKYGVSSKEISKANKLRSKDAIREGQLLIIPGQKERTADINTTTSPATPETEETILVAAQRPEKKKEPRIKSKETASAEDEILVASAEIEEDILIAQPAPATTYKVKNGDTIWDIARKYGLSEKQILTANNLQKKQMLRLGQQLVIPTKKSLKTKSAKNKPPRTTQSGKTYVVKSGDTIWKIAKKHGISEGQLLAVNNLPKKHVLRPGQKLIIP